MFSSFHYRCSSAMCMSAARTLQTRMESLIQNLSDPGVYYPGRLDDCLEQLRPLFNAEEILMIQTRYPDYPLQQMAHRCFMREMLGLRGNGLFSENEKCACEWLTRHESVGGSLFRIYLNDLMPEKKPDICRMPMPENVMMTMKIL